MTPLKWILLTISVLFIIGGCEAPAAPAGSPAKVLPFVGGGYTENYDGTTGNFSLYLAEGKVDGPSIKNAEVTLDNVAVGMGSYGYYSWYSAPKLVAGETHTVKIKHANFEPIEFEIVVPDGEPDGITVLDGPADWYVAQDTTVERKYTVATTASNGVWSDVLVKGHYFDRFSNPQYTYLYQPAGSVAQTCTVDAGKGWFVGFEVRKLAKVVPSGTAKGSLFTAEGLEQKLTGYEPLVASASLARIDLRFDGENTSAYVTFSDSQYKATTAQEVTIDGTLLSSSDANKYFSTTWSGQKWAENTVVPYSFKDVAGKVTSGTFTWHTADYSLPLSTPSKGNLAGTKQVSFPAPEGGWPTGVRIYAKVQMTSNDLWSTSRYGYGTSPILFENLVSGTSVLDYGTAESVEFRGVLETQLPIVGYRGMVTLGGGGALW